MIVKERREIDTGFSGLRTETRIVDLGDCPEAPEGTIELDKDTPCHDWQTEEKTDGGS